MNKKYLFMLFCVTSLFAQIPAADAYSVVVIYTSKGRGPQHENVEYDHYDKVSRSAVEKRALEGVQLEGGIDPKIVLSTDKPGYFAVAISEGQNSRIIGWSGPLPSSEAAKKEAIANCKKRGGTDPRIKEAWRDGVSGEKE
jgi:hypothetical protein